MALTNEINKIISDPGFDPTEYFKHIDLHCRIRGLTSSLINEPGIFLSIVKSDNHRYLERAASLVKEDIFPNLHKNGGLEVWTKYNSIGNKWHGLIVDENCIVYHKYINGNRHVHIEKDGHKNQFGYDSKTTGVGGLSRKSIKNADWWRKEWTRLGLCKIGEESPVLSQKVLGNRPIDHIRDHLINTMKEIGYSSNRKVRNTTANMSFRCVGGPAYKLGEGFYHQHKIKVRVSNSGKSVKIVLVDSLTFSNYTDIKFKIANNPKKQADEILSWISKQKSHSVLKKALEGPGRQILNGLR